MNIIRHLSKIILAVFVFILAFNAYTQSPQRLIDLKSTIPEAKLSDVFLVHIDGGEQISRVKIEKNNLIFTDEMGVDNPLSVKLEGKLLIIKNDKSDTVVPLLRRIEDPKRLTFLNNLGMAVATPQELKNQALRFMVSGKELYAPIGLTRESLLFMNEMGGVMSVPFVINGSALIFFDESGKPFEMYVR